MLKNLPHTARSSEINEFGTSKLTKHSQEQRNQRKLYIKAYQTLPGTTKSTKSATQCLPDVAQNLCAKEGGNYPLELQASIWYTFAWNWCYDFKH